MNSKILNFKAIGDERGWLTPLETGSEIPFDIKRVYFIYGTILQIDRGFHAHRDLEQIAVCVSGSCRFVLDDGQQRETYFLDRPSKGLYMGSMIWREMTDLSNDCVIVVMASKLYDPDDYIKDYDEFKQLSLTNSFEAKK